MTPDDARKLLGGYATGSLTEAERKALFEAALEDQELFDELAGEQVLKEVLDEPGARQRLLAALEPPRKHRAWLWVPAAATVAIAVVIGVVISQRTPPPEPPQQIAQVLKSPEPVTRQPRRSRPAGASPAPLNEKSHQLLQPGTACGTEERERRAAGGPASRSQTASGRPRSGFVASAPAAAARRAENAAVRAPAYLRLATRSARTDSWRSRLPRADSCWLQQGML